MPFIASLTARIEEGWHVYAITQPPGGPKALAVRVAPGQFVHLDGNVTGPKPRSVYDLAFDMSTQSYERSASFEVPLAVEKSTLPGESRATVEVFYQACSERRCLTPATAQVPLMLNVSRSKEERGQ